MSENLHITMANFVNKLELDENRLLILSPGILQGRRVSAQCFSLNMLQNNAQLAQKFLQAMTEGRFGGARRGSEGFKDLRFGTDMVAKLLTVPPRSNNEETSAEDPHDLNQDNIQLDLDNVKLEGIDADSYQHLLEILEIGLHHIGVEHKDVVHDKKQHVKTAPPKPAEEKPEVIAPNRGFSRNERQRQESTYQQELKQIAEAGQKKADKKFRDAKEAFEHEKKARHIKRDEILTDNLEIDVLKEQRKDL